MGYVIHQLPSRFLLSARQTEAALAAVKSLAGQETCGHSEKMHFMWLPDSAAFTSAPCLDEALRIWRWNADVDDEDSIIALDFSGEKLGDEDLLFTALAPFVESGSYLTVVGEDGAVWRWKFEDGKVDREWGTVTFQTNKGEPSAAPNGDPATQFQNSRAVEGPPSVS